MRRRTKISIAPVKGQTAFENWKHKQYFDFIWSEIKVLVGMYDKIDHSNLLHLLQ